MATTKKTTTTKTTKSAPAKKAAPAKKVAPAKKTDTVSHDYHVSLNKETKKWKVFNAGSDKVIKLFDTQAEALKYAKELAKKNDGSVMLHGLDGKLRKF